MLMNTNWNQANIILNQILAGNTMNRKDSLRDGFLICST